MHRRVWHVCEVANKSFVNQFTACPQLSRLEPCAPVARVHSSSSPPEGRISVPNTAKRERDGNRVWMDLQSVRERLQQLQASGCHIDKPAVAEREAAVLVPLFQDECGVVRVILTQRSANLRNHAGEVALPGGKTDPEDTSPTATALREANEEMGLDPGVVDVLATLPPVLSKHCLSVTTVIGMLSARVSDVLRASPDEVERIFDMPLHFFLEQNDRHSFRDAAMGTYTYRIHYFQYDEFEVWGLTAGILIRVAEAAFGRQADFDVIGDGVDYARLRYDGTAVMLAAVDKLDTTVC